jgi:geranylgeranyl diphosphate synthase type I
LTATADPLIAPYDPSTIRTAVDRCLDTFLSAKAQEAASDHMPPDVVEMLREFLLSGGKRLRPLFCVYGWHAAGGRGVPPPVVQTAAALEVFHAFALIHDDVMDESDIRRGRPSLHRALESKFALHHERPQARWLGTHVAVLLGDLAFAWSGELLHTAGISSARMDRVLPVVSRMRTEMMYGQYLDLVSSRTEVPDPATSLKVVQLKTAKYTIERPLHLGAILAGASDAVLRTLSDYAMPLGTAFQLRDDLLGTFGDPELTGKSDDDDLREGKATVLVALALARADPHASSSLRRILGDRSLTAAQADTARQIIAGCGARQEVESLIRRYHAEAIRVLDRGASLLSPNGSQALHALATTALKRHS